MSTLFLTSAGLSPEIKNDFLNLLPNKPENTNVCFIPTAADPEGDKWFIEKDREQLKETGFKVNEVDLKEENKESIINKISLCDVIWVCGGNTFYLLDWVRKSGFGQILPELLNQGKIYVGVSAGSIVVGPDIESAGWEGMDVCDENIVHIEDLKGLGLVSFVVSPHFTENDRKVLEEHVKSVDYPIIALNDMQAVLIKGSEVRLLGSGERVIFGKKYPL